MLSGSIRMEGMQKHQYWMDKEPLANITAKWFFNYQYFLLLYNRQVNLVTNHISPPPLKIFFQVSELPTH